MRFFSMSCCTSGTSPSPAGESLPGPRDGRDAAQRRRDHGAAGGLGRWGGGHGEIAAAVCTSREVGREASAICHMAWMTWDGMGINNWWSPMGTGLFWEPPDGPLTIDVVTKIAMKEPWTYGKYRLETMYFNICIGWHTSFSSTRGFLLHKPKIGIQKQ